MPEVSRAGLRAARTGLAAFAALRTRLKSIDGSIALAAVASLSLRLLVPANVVPNSPHDDLLGVQLARAMLHGHWLGAWNNRILAKPPGYALFLAAIHPLGLPPTVVIHALYLVLGLYMLYLLDRSRHLAPAHSLASRVLFLLFAFNPGMLGGDISRVYRTSLNAVAALLYALSFFHLVLVVKETRFGHVVWGHAVALPAVLLGLAYAAMVLTRTEAYWVLVPSATILLLLSIAGRFWRTEALPAAGRLVAALVLASLAAWAPLAMVRHANMAAYGVAMVENLHSGNFARAVNLWASVLDGRDARSFITVARGQRQAVYEVSATAASLQAYLETPPGAGWKGESCAGTGVCDESGAWFVFELRDAAVIAGQLTNEVEFQAFFARIAEDISAAAAAGRLRCGRPGFTPGAKSLRDYSPKQLLDTSVKALGSLIAFEQGGNVSRPDFSQGSELPAIWQRVAHVDRVVTTGEGDLWRAMGHTVRVLGNFYSGLSPLLCALVAFALLQGPRNGIEDGSYWFLVHLALCVALHCGGTAVFEASLGFPVAFSFYALPVQPVFLLALLIGTASSISTLLDRFLPGDR